MPPVVLGFSLFIGLQGVKPLEALKNLHFIIPKTGSKTEQKHVDGFAVFVCIAVQLHRKLPKGPKF